MLDNFLLNTTERHSPEFAGLDKKELFEKNLKVMPYDWHYRTKQVNYRSNKLLYRTDEFENIDWNNSIILFGCSHVFGIGLAEDETISSYIKNITGYNTVNMGISASSIYHAYINQLILHKMNARPLAIVNVWTSTDRFIYFTDNSIISIGPWMSNWKTTFYRDFFNMWTYEPKHAEILALMVQQSTLVLNKGINHYECTFFESTSKTFMVDFLEKDDEARDLMHPGPISCKKAAMKIINNLKL